MFEPPTKTKYIRVPTTAKMAMVAIDEIPRCIIIDCKAIAYCGATDEFILSKLPVEKDEFVTPLAELDSFVENAKSRLWEREPKVRDLA